MPGIGVHNFATGSVHIALDCWLGNAVNERTCSTCVNIALSTRGNRAIMNTSMVPQRTARLAHAVETIHTWRGPMSRRVWARVFTHSRVNAAMHIAQIARNEAISASAPGRAWQPAQR